MSPPRPARYAAGTSSPPKRSDWHCWDYRAGSRGRSRGIPRDAAGCTGCRGIPRALRQDPAASRVGPCGFTGHIPDEMSSDTADAVGSHGIPHGVLWHPMGIPAQVPTGILRGSSRDALGCLRVFASSRLRSFVFPTRGFLSTATYIKESLPTHVPTEPAS